jgi:hypothetical protein
VTDGPTAPSDNEGLVADVIDHLLARDLDTVMRRYDDDALLHIGGFVSYEGASAIRAYFEVALAGAPPRTDFVRVIESDADGRVAMRWQLVDQTGGAVIASGEDHYRFDRGLIVEQIVSHHPTSTYDSAP